MMTTKIKLDGGIMPRKATPYAAAYDLFLSEDVVLSRGRQVLPLGFSMELPRGYRAIIEGRSGFSAKGVEVRYERLSLDREVLYVEEHFRIDADVLTGIIDSDYRNPVGVLFKVHEAIFSYERFTLPKGVRIAQMMIQEVPDMELTECDELDMTDDRGGGFGHTGT